ncbi:hypothetical protein OCH239_09385 [Roseivivax halodurans JCM 10272]|uniref:Uncharacterized protein n=1 Tax=Roseivivax halodurans JCM 10272 TaxID=1449350 RepID=X7ECI6_9RHOB|nr:hypothetical protein [Roseivivax halodurans]ETX13662.1 hypothetical protein OCH239_09385 [Roseivivax halodurans JCM 10272]
MSCAVRDQQGLSALTEEIRWRYGDEYEPAVRLDGWPQTEGERRKTAARLLEPVYPEDRDNDLSPEEWLEVCCVSWDMRIGTDGKPADTPQARMARQALQYRHTQAWVARCWGLDGPEPPVPEPEPETDWDAPVFVMTTDAGGDPDDTVDHDFDLEVDLDDDDLFELDEDDTAAEANDRRRDGEYAQTVSAEEVLAEIDDLFDSAGPDTTSDPEEIPF